MSENEGEGSEEERKQGCDREREDLRKGKV